MAERARIAPLALAVALVLGALAAPVAGAPSVDARTRHRAARAGALPAPPTRDLARARGVRFGTAVAPALLQDEADYAAVVAGEFDLVEPENAMKWESVHPEPDRYDFTGGDAVVAFADANHQQVRGHTLAWHRQNPSWLTNLTPTRTEAVELLRTHIATVVGHYRGRVTEWDVVNEALADTGTGLRPTLWQRWIGDDYLDLAFRFAHDADPAARLVYNDYDLGGVGAKSHRIVALAASMKRRGVPIDGIGLQFHVFAPVTQAQVAEVLQEAAAAGLTVSVTELDVALALPASPADLQAQAERFRAVVAACAAAPTCTTVNLWGFTDRHSWVPGEFPGFGAATPLDEDLSPKPAWAAIRSAFADPSPPSTSTTVIASSTVPDGSGDPSPAAGAAIPVPAVPAYTG